MPYTLQDLRYQQMVRKPSELKVHLKSFHLKPKFSVGIWYFAPGGGRFHDRYVPDLDVKARLELARSFAPLGVQGIEAHFPAEINRDNLELYDRLKEEVGIRVVGIPFSHFFAKEFEFGSLSNPDAAIRKKAIEVAADGLQLVKDIGAENAISWPGIDGYTYPLGTYYNLMWDNFESSLAEAMDRVPGVRVAIEPKPYEPAPNNIYRTTAEGILAAQRIEVKLQNPENKKLLKEGHSLVGLNPEIGHVAMGFEPLAAAYTLVGKYGKLAHTHWNSQPLGNYDQDLNVGVVAVQDAMALLYALKIMGYREWFGIDINPERMPVQKALEINIQAIHRLNEKIETLPHDHLLACYLDPTHHRGEIEEILLKSL